jgi:lipopolysaccharide biosynthesis glycosyltransferase
MRHVMGDTSSAPPPRQARRAFVICITDNFISLGDVFLQSLVLSKSIPANTDVVLLTHPVYAPLNDENRRLFLRIHPSLIFEEANADFLDDELVKRWRGEKVVKQGIDADFPNKKSVYLKLCLLRMERYKALIWIDSDFMILRGVGGMFRLPFSLALVAAGPSRHGFGIDFGASRVPINSGFMLIRKPHIGMAWFEKAVSLLRERSHTSIQDQSLLQHLWRNSDIFYLPHTYNWKMQENASAAFCKEALQNAHAVHFVNVIKWRLLQPNDGNPLYDRFHELRQMAGIPLVMPG